MTTVTVTTAFGSQQFPAGTPPVAKIRYTLQKSSDGGVNWAGYGSAIDVAPGLDGVFSVPDGMYRASAQAMSTGAFLGTAVVSDPFTINTAVTLNVPISVMVAM
jgi:hypothetical protein